MDVRVLSPDELATAAKEWAGTAWAAYDTWGDVIDQDAVGLIDWASLMLTGSLEGKLIAQMAGQLRELADRLEGNEEEDAGWS